MDFNNPGGGKASKPPPPEYASEECTFEIFFTIIRTNEKTGLKLDITGFTTFNIVLLIYRYSE
jgi:hypothetical protein